MRRIAYVAGDHGPRATLEALAKRLPGTRVLEAGTELLICGTSDTVPSRHLEAQARIAASARGVPCVVIEDFPGNYCAVPGGKPRLVVVAHEFEARLAREKDPPLHAVVCPNVRYDSLRCRLHALRSQAPRTGQGVLWIGQPETEDSLETLQRLLPALTRYRIAFRAHPRDAGYACGFYAGLPVEDLTTHSLEECLARRPRLVVTQFSSAAIEAGFWGIPSLNVLFADVGGRRLAAKGYSVPPWCENGAAFLIVHTREVDEVVERAIGCTRDRHAVLRAFDRYFQVDVQGVPALVGLLYNHGLL